LPSFARPVTGSAFTQARYKIKPEFFYDLAKLTLPAYWGSNRKLWKGHILIAGDGSTLNLPPTKDIEREFGSFGVTGNGVKRYLAKIYFFYDVLNDFVFEWRMDKRKVSEKELMRSCLNDIEIPDNGIIILDRLYGNFTTVRELTGEETTFCIRLPVNVSHFAKKAMLCKENDYITTWEPSKEERRYARNNGFSQEPVKVRVTKIRLRTGEIELLVSNLLDQQKYSLQDLDELYHHRWGVEEGFKNLKPKMKIEQFGCRKAEGVRQEFHAHVFIMNIVSLFGMEASETIAKKTVKRKLTYKYNWKNAYRFLRKEIIGFLSLVDIQKLLDLVIREITSSLVALKPGRMFARDTIGLSGRARVTQFNK
jgi:hypothetical protein